MSESKRSIWALIGKALWFVIRTVLKVVAKFGSRWAKNKLEQRSAQQDVPAGRAERRSRR